MLSDPTHQALRATFLFLRWTAARGMNKREAKATGKMRKLFEAAVVVKVIVISQPSLFPCLTLTVAHLEEIIS
jgi:hypothetical protein